MSDEKSLLEKISELSDYHNFILKNYYNSETYNVDEIYEILLTQFQLYKNCIIDVPEYIDGAFASGQKIVFEGAQGTLLDIDHGTYPFVTSSNTTVGGIFTGSGVSPKRLDYVLAIVKAYTTRVGSGPFMTELFNEEGKILSERGHEYGATTGRERRCGWLDLIALKRSIIINGFTGICLTKLDVLDTFQNIKVCMEYKDNKPLYENYAGWETNISGIKTYEELPKNAKIYIKAIEDYLGVPIDIISNGPGREQNIIKNKIF